MTTKLIKRVTDFSRQNNLWNKGSKIVLGVSGGPDSVCLLDIFLRLQKKYLLELIVAHVNYGLRQKDSDRDEEFVAKLAKRHGLKFVLFKPKTNRQERSENALRDLRYAFFEKVRKDNGFDSIAIAHNLNDQVETFLMRLLRGSGLNGLTGMSPKNKAIIRPLLEITREDILEYLRKNNLKFRVDRTNLENTFLRNKVRNKIIPLLRKEFNPSILKTLSRTMTHISEDLSLIDKLTQSHYPKNGELQVKKMLSLHPSLQRRLLIMAIKNTRSTLKDIETSHITEILKALRSTKSKSQTVLFKGLKLVRKGDRVILSQN